MVYHDLRHAQKVYSPFLWKRTCVCICDLHSVELCLECGEQTRAVSTGTTGKQATLTRVCLVVHERVDFEFLQNNSKCQWYKNSSNIKNSSEMRSRTQRNHQLSILKSVIREYASIHPRDPNKSTVFMIGRGQKSSECLHDEQAAHD